MKPLILIIIFTVFASFYLTKYIPATKLKIPPGTVLIKDSLFIDRTEISNQAWKEFTNQWLLNHERDTDLYNQMLPDSTVWLSMKADGKLYMYEYFQTSTFDDYPVVGITYEQAVAFCKWRTDQVNAMLERNNNIGIREVEYRLPTEKEWERAAQGKTNPDSFPHGQDPFFKIKDEEYKSFNCYYPEIDSASWIEGKIAKVDFSPANLYGISNMMGNVAEMVTEKGLAKGGDYDVPLKYCTVKEKFSYSGSNRWLGFRCVCLVNKIYDPKKPPESGFKKEKKIKERGFIKP